MNPLYRTNLKPQRLITLPRIKTLRERGTLPRQKMPADQLAECIERLPNAEAIDGIIRQYYPLMYTVIGKALAAEKYYGYAQYTEDDLLAMAMEVIWRACLDWKPRETENPTTYLDRLLKNALGNAVESAHEAKVKQHRGMPETDPETWEDLPVKPEDAERYALDIQPINRLRRRRAKKGEDPATIPVARRLKDELLNACWSHENDPYEVLMMKTEYPVEKRRVSQARLNFILNVHPGPTDEIYLWLDGKSNDEVAEATGQHVTTVRRHRRELERLIKEEAAHLEELHYGFDYLF